MRKALSNKGEIMKTACIVYLPVVHNGYLRFLDSVGPNTTVYLLGKEFWKLVPQLERDIRALEPSVICPVISSLINKKVEILSLKSLEDLENFSRFVLPDEDISYRFAEQYLSRREVEFQAVSLRWDMLKTLSKHPPEEEVSVSRSSFDLFVLGVLNEEAKKSPDWWRQVAACLVKKGTILKVAHNTHLPHNHEISFAGDPRLNFEAGQRYDLSLGLHAEASLISEAAKNGEKLQDVHLYVTTFPCPTCARLIINAGIVKVYYRDGYSLLASAQLLKDAGVELVRILS